MPAETDVPESTRLGKYSRYWQLPRRLATAMFQIRTGRIGLAGFLWKSKAFGTFSPLCRCGDAPETVEHIVCYCTLFEREQATLRRDLEGSNPLANGKDIEKLIDKP